MKKNNTIQIRKQPKIHFSNLYTNFIKPNTILGHNSLKLQQSCHSKLNNFFLGTRNKTLILNYKFTLKCLIKALYIFVAIIKSNGNVLIINTNPELSKLLYHIKQNTECKYLFFSDCGWTKGNLTNLKQVYGKIKTFASFYHNFDDFLNKNNIHFPNYNKMKKSYKGFLNKTISLKNLSEKTHHNTNFFFEKKKVLFKNLPTGKNNKKSPYFLNLNSEWKPDIVVLMSTNNVESIINEACSINVPIIGFLDSNSNTHNITYPIPVNTYYHYFIWLFFNFFTKINNKHYFAKLK